jgi:hypothetical protein
MEDGPGAGRKVRNGDGPKSKRAKLITSDPTNKGNLVPHVFSIRAAVKAPKMKMTEKALIMRPYFHDGRPYLNSRYVWKNTPHALNENTTMKLMA